MPCRQAQLAAKCSHGFISGNSPQGSGAAGQGTCLQAQPAPGGHRILGPTGDQAQPGSLGLEPLQILSSQKPASYVHCSKCSMTKPDADCFAEHKVVVAGILHAMCVVDAYLDMAGCSKGSLTSTRRLGTYSYRNKVIEPFTPFKRDQELPGDTPLAFPGYLTENLEFRLGEIEPVVYAKNRQELNRQPPLYRKLIHRLGKPVGGYTAAYRCLQAMRT